MASITLDLGNYTDNEGNFSAQTLHELTAGLRVTFGEVGDYVTEPGEILVDVEIEFTGSYEDLIALIDRYEEDPGLRPGLIAEITNIHA